MRRLVDRDRKELDYDALEDSFKAEPPKDGSSGAEAAAASSSSAAAAGTGPTPTMTSFTTGVQSMATITPVSILVIGMPGEDRAAQHSAGFWVVTAAERLAGHPVGHPAGSSRSGWLAGPVTQAFLVAATVKEY